MNYWSPAYVGVLFGISEKSGLGFILSGKNGSMSQIVLDTNLKYVIAGLSLEQRGKLLDAILGEAIEALDDVAVENIFKYISALQIEVENKRKRMKEIGAIGNAVKRKKALEKGFLSELFGNGGAVAADDDKKCLFSEVLAGDANAERVQCVGDENVKRKVPKENKYIKLNNIYVGDENKDNLEEVNNLNFRQGSKSALRSLAKQIAKSGVNVDVEKIFESKKKKKTKGNGEKFGKICEFVAPSVEEVRVFVEKEKLQVDAETFVNFYESRGWYMGKTLIRNWQATVRLWHRRVQVNKVNDEGYWHELNDKFSANSENGVSQKIADDKKFLQNGSVLNHSAGEQTNLSCEVPKGWTKALVSGEGKSSVVLGEKIEETDGMKNLENNASKDRFAEFAMYMKKNEEIKYE